MSEEAGFHRTTLRLDVDLIQGLKRIALLERRSITNLIEEAGWMLLEARGDKEPLARRIQRLNGIHEG